MMRLLDFYQGKKILITGHTGFKGTWLSKILIDAGAFVSGYALQPSDNPCFFDLANITNGMHSVLGDIRDIDRISTLIEEFEPEIVIHMAAQAIVRDGYRDPVYTYGTNVMGTVNILEAIRKTHCVRSFLNVTTDKVYENKEINTGYVETDVLNGIDPYSNSKSCSELVTQSYKRSFFHDRNCAISTARAGNVIGGGDFSKDRIIPDCVSAAISHEKISVRNPNSVRPYQHVLEPLFAYLMIAKKQYENSDYSGYYNVGPDESDCLTTKDLVDLFCENWGDISWENKAEKNAPHEAGLLKLNCNKLRKTFEWMPVWNAKTAVSMTCDWYKRWQKDQNISDIMSGQIRKYYESFLVNE